MLASDDLPSEGEFVTTHVQIDEINNTLDKERRARLFLQFTIMFTICYKYCWSRNGRHIRLPRVCTAFALAMQLPGTVDQSDTNPAEDGHQPISCHLWEKIEEGCSSQKY